MQKNPSFGRALLTQIIHEHDNKTIRCTFKMTQNDMEGGSVICVWYVYFVEIGTDHSVYAVFRWNVLIFWQTSIILH